MKKLTMSGLVVLLVLLCGSTWSIAQQSFGPGSEYGVGSGESPGYGQGSEYGYGPGPEYGYGPGPVYGYGSGDGGGPFHNVLEGTPFTYAGIVSSMGIPGNGLVLSTAEYGEVTIYGIGPIWFWENEEHPGAGDQIEVSGYTVTYEDGTVRNIAMSIIIFIDESAVVEVELRDPVTGLPLWRVLRGRAAR